MNIYIVNNLQIWKIWTGWWLTYPSEKYESQLGLWEDPRNGSSDVRFRVVPGAHTPHSLATLVISTALAPLTLAKLKTPPLHWLKDGKIDRKHAETMGFSIWIFPRLIRENSVNLCEFALKPIVTRLKNRNVKVRGNCQPRNFTYQVSSDLNNHWSVKTRAAPLQFKNCTITKF